MIRVVIHSNVPDHPLWIPVFKNHLPSAKVEVWPDVESPDMTDVAVVWLRANDIFSHFPNLQLVLSCGVGVETLLREISLPKSVNVVRLTDFGLRDQVSDYVTLAVLQHTRNWNHFRMCQGARIWESPLSPLRKPEVGLMGAGTIGVEAYRKLTALGFNVNVWVRTIKSRQVTNVYVGESELESFARKSEVLVCMLPLTKNTHEILNRQLFDTLPKGAYLINVGRGEQIVEADLLSALDCGQLSGACLDVFAKEPMPGDCWIWSHPKVTVTPHIASRLNAEDQAMYAIDVISKHFDRKPMEGVVNRDIGY